tara:strand:+ start:382 stop:804 length:423 start_codon:yes stop_codon:yes gene_type:complete
MFKTILKAFYSVFILIVLASILLAGWTSYSFISQPSKSDEIIRVIKDMYGSQKAVIFDFVDLTSILIKEKNLSENNENTNLSTKKDSLKVVEDNSLVIGREPYTNEFGEDILPENSKEPLVNVEKESSMNEMLDGMDINP